MSDSEPDEQYDKFADAVIDVSVIMAPAKVIPTVSSKKCIKQQLTNNYKELLSRYLYDNFESSLKIKNPKSPNKESIKLEEDDVILFKSCCIQESSKNSSLTLNEELKKPSKKRKASSSDSDDDSENMERFCMAAMTGEMLISARQALNGSSTTADQQNMINKNGEHIAKPTTM